LRRQAEAERLRELSARRPVQLTALVLEGGGGEILRSAAMAAWAESNVWAESAVPCAKADATQNIASNRAILIFFIPFFSCFAIMVRKGISFVINIDFFLGLVNFFLLFLFF
jgi:hypothetical protein